MFGYDIGQVYTVSSSNGSKPSMSLQGYFIDTVLNNQRTICAPDNLFLGGDGGGL